jgi:hypothetical protein
MSPAHKLSERTPQSPWRPECAICKEPVKLEDSKADERGQAVHEDCYVSQINRKKTSVDWVMN